MKPLQRLWQSLEDIAGLVAVLADWRNRLGQDFDAAYSLLRPTDQRAHSYPDVNDPYSHYRVVTHSDHDIVGVHSSNSSTINLTDSEVLIYRLDTKRLCRIIAESLGFDSSQLSTNGADGPSLIGVYRPFVGFGFPVYFAIPDKLILKCKPLPFAWSYLNALYFSVITFATVGYGDVRAVGWAAGLAMVEGLLGIALNAALVVVIFRKLIR